MKKLGSFAKLTLKIIRLTSIFVLLVFTLISLKVKTDIICKNIPPQNQLTDTAIIHFIHGSIVMEDCVFARKRLGGLLGGHAEIEVEGIVYGFLQNTLPIHNIPQDTFNAKFEVTQKEIWVKKKEYEKITSIYLPISKEQKKNLQNIFEKYSNKIPYDYAFLGQRCSSSTAEILSQAGIINKFSNFEFIVSFFYPRPLRFTMLKLAEKNKFPVLIKEGVNCRIWE